MSKGWLMALAGGVLSVLASMAFLGGSPGGWFFVYLAPLPLLLAGLGLGPAAATVAGGGAIVVAGLAAGLLAAGFYGLVFVLPTWLVAQLAFIKRQDADGALSWFPAGWILSWLAVLAAAVLLVASAMSYDIGVDKAVSMHLNDAFSVIASSLPEANRQQWEANRPQFVALLTPLFPGVVGTTWVMLTVLNGAVAQALLVRMKRNLRPSPSFSGLALPHWMSWLVVGGATVALIGSGQMEYIGRNLVVILAVPFFFLGLAVIHAAIKRTPFPGALLAVFYLAFMFFGWIVFAVAGIGLAEQWAGLRQRFASPGKEKE